MRNIHICDLSFLGVVKRFYLMMLAVILAGFMKQFVLAAILGFAIAVSFILGISYAPAVPQKRRKIRLKKKRSATREAA